MRVEKTMPCAKGAVSAPEAAVCVSEMLDARLRERSARKTSVSDDVCVVRAVAWTHRVEHDPCVGRAHDARAHERGEPARVHRRCSPGHPYAHTRRPTATHRTR